MLLRVALSGHEKEQDTSPETLDPPQKPSPSPRHPHSEDRAMASWHFFILLSFGSCP